MGQRPRSGRRHGPAAISASSFPARPSRVCHLRGFTRPAYIDGDRVLDCCSRTRADPDGSLGVSANTDSADEQHPDRRPDALEGEDFEYALYHVERDIAQLLETPST